MSSRATHQTSKTSSPRNTPPPDQALMTEITIEDIENIARDQYNNKGMIDQGLINLILKDWGIDLSHYKNQETARELWNNMITLHLVNPDAYQDACKKIQNMFEKLDRGDHIPDIHA